MFRDPTARATHWDENQCDAFLDAHPRYENDLPLSRRVAPRMGDGRGPGAAALRPDVFDDEAGDESDHAPHDGRAATAARALGNASTPARSMRPAGEASDAGDEASYTPRADELSAERAPLAPSAARVAPPLALSMRFLGEADADDEAAYTPSAARAARASSSAALAARGAVQQGAAPRPHFRLPIGFLLVLCTPIALIQSYDAVI